MTSNGTSPKEALINWANKNNVTIADFSGRMGYTYSYAWQLLRGEATVSFELIGRMAVLYGIRAASPIIRAMAQSDKQNC